MLPPPALPTPVLPTLALLTRVPQPMVALLLTAAALRMIAVLPDAARRIIADDFGADVMGRSHRFRPLLFLVAELLRFIPAFTQRQAIRRIGSESSFSERIMMKTLSILAVIAAGFAATPALAQSAAPGGLYVAAIGGYEGVDVETGDGTATATADSAVYGLAAGYDLSLGSAFVGVEGEISTSGSDTRFPDSFGTARDGLEADGQYYLGARAGIALTPGISAYGKVGYTALDTRAFTQAGSLGDIEDNANGIRFGGGVQVQLPGPLEARLEYRRSRYEEVGDGAFGDATTDQVVAGIGIRF